MTSLSRLLVIFLLLQVACKTPYQPSSLQYESYDVSGKTADSSYASLLTPYREKVDATMNDPVAELQVNLIKSLPDGTLGNFIADAYLFMAREKFDKQAQLAYMNHGGIRRNGISAGPVRRGTIYELMPFDNLMIIQKVKGSLLQEFLDHIAEEGGGGLAGVKMSIQHKKATKVFIQGQPINPDATYTMVNSDYVVNGGGKFTGFRNEPMHKTGYLLRDAILDYCTYYKQAAKPLPVDTEKRISNE